MLEMPASISLANLPTRIEKLERLSKELGKNIYIKRDDFTGCEISGNKVRKLEFSIKEGIDQGCDTFITCGGIQSNHARATAAVAARLGLRVILVLRSNEEPAMEGNYFVDKLLGADVRIITSEEYSEKRQEIMEKIKADTDAAGHKAYIIPEGASNGIGTFGYLKCMKEIEEQEKGLGITFDTILSAVGSGGTYGGLFLGNKLLGLGKKVVGVNVCDDAEFFKNRIKDIINESLKYLEEKLEFSKDEMCMIDGYVGRGYALSRPEELEFIAKLGREEGIILDPVYTGKTMYGFYNEVKKGNLKDCKNILFIHTGGFFGLFPKQKEFKF